MRHCYRYMLLLLSCAWIAPLHAQFIALDSQERTTDEINASRQITDNTKAPNSWVGNTAEGLARAAASGAAAKAAGKWVTVDVEMICGFARHCPTKTFSLSGGTGYLPEKSTKGKQLSIHDVGNGLAGMYYWTASFEGEGSCSGKVAVGRRDVSIRVSPSCKDAGTYEHQ